MQNDLDFLCDTLLHISEVQANLKAITAKLEERGLLHDRSKLADPEFSLFVKTRDAFKAASYGTPEYDRCCEDARPAIDHHHANNRHHIVFDVGRAITLIDIIEMICDWKAAARRNPDKPLADTIDYSLEKNVPSETLRKLIKNTLKELGWI